MASEMEIGVLGPLEIRDARGETVALSSPTQRRVLAALVIHRGAAIAPERLAEELDMSSAGLRTAISRLRDALGASTIATEASGYVLAGCQVDDDFFRDQLSQTRNADKASALTHLDAALMQCRGPAYTEFAHADWARPEAAYLDELHSGAVEDRADALIGVGRFAEAAAAMQAHAARHPLRDRPQALLMRALAAQGRQPEALRSYQHYRTYLGEEIGTEPGDELVELEARIVTGWRDIADHTTLEAVTDSHSRPHTRPLSGNLPSPLASFVGRQAELTEIAQLLSTNRLVTLTGLGGIGKTSLALRVGAESAENHPDGAWLVDLVSIDDATPMVDAFIDVLAPRPSPGADPMAYLLEHVAALDTLLVVDNCEDRLLDVTDMVSQILQSAPNVHVLATSRTALSAPGEAVWRLAPLDGSTEAVELFADRTRLVRPDFLINETNRQLVVQICKRLDGIPLAIELAAARLNVTSLDQIIAHLDDRFRLLTASRSSGERIQTLQGALSWSFDLLEAGEQSALRRLSVFGGSFKLHAVQHVVAPVQDAISSLDALGALVDSNLLTVDAHDPEPRYRLLETVRSYAYAQMGQEEATDAHLSHAHYYLSLATELRAKDDTDHERALQGVDADLANFRTAMSWCNTSGHPALAVEMAHQLRVYFWSRRMNREGLRWLRAGLRQLDDDSDQTLLALADVLVFADNVEDLEAQAWARTRIEAALGDCREPAVRSRLLCSLAGDSSEVDPRRAEELLAEATALALKATGSGLAGANLLSCLNNRTEISWLAGDMRDVTGIREALATFGDSETRHPVCSKIEIGLAARAGDWEAVLQWSGQAGSHLDTELIASRLQFRAEALGALGRTDEAIATLDELVQLEARHNTGYVSDEPLVRAAIELKRSSTDVALSVLIDTASVRVGTRPRSASRVPISALAATAADQMDRHEDAAVLHGYSSALAKDLDVSLRPSNRPLVEQAREQSRAALGQDQFDTLLAEGANASWSDVAERLASLAQP